MPLSRRLTATSTRGIVVSLIACGVVLRLAFLGADSLWLDEAYSVTAVVQQQSARDVWEKSLDPNHPPLFFLILWTTFRVAGVSEATARLPSALASVFSLALLFVLARRLGASRRAATWAVLLLALAPVDIWYAQEARMYALVTMMALAFAIALTVQSPMGAAGVAAALSAGLYMDFTMVALSALLTSLWFVYWCHGDRRPTAVLLVIVAHAAAWIAFEPRWAQLGEVLRRIDTVPLLVKLREWFGLRIASGAPAVVLMITVAVAAGVVAAAVWDRLRGDRFRTWWSRLAWAGFVASTVALAVPRAYSAKQFLATGWPFVTLVVAWTLTDGEREGVTGRAFHRWRLPLALCVSAVAAAITVLTPRADWRGVVAYLDQRADRTEAVWLDPPWNSVAYGFYRPAIAAVTNPLEASTVDRDVQAGREVCLVAQRFGSTPPTSPSEAWLDGHLRLVEAVSFARLEVRCYSN